MQPKYIPVFYELFCSLIPQGHSMRITQLIILTSLRLGCSAIQAHTHIQAAVSSGCLVRTLVEHKDRPRAWYSVS